MSAKEADSKEAAAPRPKQESTASKAPRPAQSSPRPGGLLQSIALSGVEGASQKLPGVPVGVIEIRARLESRRPPAPEAASKPTEPRRPMPSDVDWDAWMAEEHQPEIHEVPEEIRASADSSQEGEYPTADSGAEQSWVPNTETAQSEDSEAVPNAPTRAHEASARVLKATDKPPLPPPALRRKAAQTPKAEPPRAEPSEASTPVQLESGAAQVTTSEAESKIEAEPNAEAAPPVQVASVEMEASEVGIETLPPTRRKTMVRVVWLGAAGLVLAIAIGAGASRWVAKGTRPSVPAVPSARASVVATPSQTVPETASASAAAPPVSATPVSSPEPIASVAPPAPEVTTVRPRTKSSGKKKAGGYVPKGI